MMTLYNNLRVFEQELTSTSKSSASAQNVAFVSHSKSSTNKVKSGHTGAYSTCTPTSSNNFQEREVPAGFADEVIYSLFAKQSEDLDLLHEDLEQIDDIDIEEMDINWQIAMIAIRMKKFYKKLEERPIWNGNKPVENAPPREQIWKEERLPFYQDQELERKSKIKLFADYLRKVVVQLGRTYSKGRRDKSALMAISLNTEVYIMFLKLALIHKLSFKTLCDEQMNQLAKDIFGNPSEHSSESESEQISVPNEMSASKSVQLNAVRQNVNSVRPNDNTGRGNWGTAVKTSAGYNWRRPRPNSNYNSGSNFVRTDHPLKNMEDRGIFDSGCSGHMTGNKDHLDDFEEYKGGSVTFGGSKGYITGKGRIRVEKPNVKGVGYRWMFDNDYLTDSMNYIPVSLDNQSNPHAGTSEVTNSANTLQTPNANASEEADEDEELIVVPTAIKHSAAKVGSRKSSTNSKEEKFLTELQNLQTQEKEAFSTGISEDTPEILAFRRDLDQLAQKNLREVTTDKATSTNSLNSGSEPANTQPADQDDSDMPELTIFNKPQKGIFDEASYDEEDMLKKFNLASMKTAITPMETKMALTKDEEADEVDVHLYRSMIGSLMYLTASRPDIIFAVCACSRFQVRILQKSQENGHNQTNTDTGTELSVQNPGECYQVTMLGKLDQEIHNGGCQFLGSRLISWQCKKQTIVATSTTEAEYVAAASCCGQVLWIQNQMLDYGFNFMNTKIHIDNESTICIVKNPVYHSKTKHIEIRHHFIRDSYEKKLIRVEKIHTDFNVADLLTKAFDGPRFNFLVVNIGMINP
ncbi:hypothetical protein Tco_1353045 [Tanacetum coccineum]